MSRASTPWVVLSVAAALVAGALPASAQPPLKATTTVSLAGSGGEPRVLSTSVVYYDSQSRMREEHTDFDAQGRPARTLVTISDPNAQRFYILDPSNRTAEERYFREPVATDRLPGEPGSPHPEGSFTVRPAAELGEQLIEGRPCYGTVYGESPVFDWQVTWWDRETGLALLQIERRKDSNVVKTTLSDIRLGDPDPGLFKIPSDYAVNRVQP